MSKSAAPPPSPGTLPKLLTGCGSVLLILVGVLLLLPGVCALSFLKIGAPNPAVTAGFFISVFGVILILAGIGWIVGLIVEGRRTDR
jgi:hypothetical protein